jgi:hypothetical protein
MAIPRHLIERCWDVYSTFMVDTGSPPPDKLYWLGGFSACMGLLVGTIQVGIPEGTQTRDVMVQLIEELEQYRAELKTLEEAARKRVN